MENDKELDSEDKEEPEINEDLEKSEEKDYIYKILRENHKFCKIIRKKLKTWMMIDLQIKYMKEKMTWIETKLQYN